MRWCSSAGTWTSSRAMCRCAPLVPRSTHRAWSKQRRKVVCMNHRAYQAALLATLLHGLLWRGPYCAELGCPHQRPSSAPLRSPPVRCEFEGLPAHRRPSIMPPPRAPATPPTRRAGPRRYNTVMKLVFLVSSATIVYYMRFHRVVRNTYDREVDTFRVVFLVAPCALAALVINQEFTPLEVPPRAPAGVLPALRRRLFWTG